MSIINNKAPTWAVSSGTTQIIKPMATSNTAITINGVAMAGHQPLTKQQNERLSELEKDFKERSRRLKIEKFKNSACEAREFVISAIKAYFCVDSVSSSLTIKSLEHTSLEEQATLSGHIPNLYNGVHERPRWPEENPYLRILNDFSLEELEKAHLEQCMEEEVLNGK